jgi:hypothetical protein
LKNNLTMQLKLQNLKTNNKNYFIHLLILTKIIQIKIKLLYYILQIFNCQLEEYHIILIKILLAKEKENSKTIQMI